MTGSTSAEVGALTGGGFPGAVARGAAAAGRVDLIAVAAAVLLLVALRKVFASFQLPM
jgi:hypothetical protein